MVCKLKMTLYGLKQAPKARYARLEKHLENLVFVKGNVDSNLYLRKNNIGLLIVEVFVDEIIFGGNGEGRNIFSKEMKK